MHIHFGFTASRHAVKKISRVFAPAYAFDHGRLRGSKRNFFRGAFAYIRVRRAERFLRFRHDDSARDKVTERGCRKVFVEFGNAFALRFL